MKTAHTLLSIALIIAVLESSYTGLAETTAPPRQSSIPYVATRNDTVQDILWIANVGKDDVVYDLGSGDGRIVIAAVRNFKARRAVGIEIDPERIQQSRQNAQKAAVTDSVKFIQGDLFTTDFSQANVVTLFLGHQPNIKLRPKMFTFLKPGTRIVSHQFGMGEWQPDKALTVRTVFLGMYGTMWSPFKNNPRVPDYTGNELTPYEGDKIFMWIVPAPIAGIWRGKIETEHGLQELKLSLHQRLSMVYGTFDFSGGENKLEGRVPVDLWGSHIRFWCRPDNVPYGRNELRFDGQVRENIMRGTLVVTEEGRHQEYEWKAQRGKVDYAGTWEWPCATGQRSVKLRIERRDDHLVATYIDGEQTIPVTDFYDYGGGFYFTLLIGRQDEHSIKITEDTGWLIGEAVFDQGSLAGRMEFYPYGDAPVPHGTGERKSPQNVIGDWRPRLVKP
jgi:SAM-dependent methyltransferase